MDIKEWLSGISPPKQPACLVEQLELPAFFRAKKDSDQLPSGKEKIKSKRKRTASDSSFLEAEKRERSSSPTKNEAKIDCAETHQKLIELSSDSSRRSTEDETSSQRYDRRPRHKTRPDRYEPKSEKPRPERKRKSKKNKADPRKAPAKTKRRSKDKPSIGLVQSFHAKNVSRDRLTMKPRENLGLFKKGRASSPARGRGLPDLVFSEMKFLRKRKEPAEEVNQDKSQSKRRKKDQTHNDDHEISAYFASARPFLAEKDTNVQSKPMPSFCGPNLVSPHTRRDRKSTSLPSAIPTVELPEKPYLGFGSRGLQPDGNSYFSWSDSIRAPSEAPAFQRAATINIGQLQPQVSKDGKDKAEVALQHSRQMSRQHATVDQTFPAPSRQIVSKSEAQRNHHSTKTLKGQESRNALDQRVTMQEQSLTTATARPPTAQARLRPTLRATYDQTDKHRSLKHCQPYVQSDRDSSIEKTTVQPALTRRTVPSSQTRVMKSRNQDSDHSDPWTSSSLAKLLNECDTALARQSREGAPRMPKRELGKQVSYIAEDGAPGIDSQEPLRQQSQLIHERDAPDGSHVAFDLRDRDISRALQQSYDFMSDEIGQDEDGFLQSELPQDLLQHADAAGYGRTDRVADAIEMPFSEGIEYGARTGMPHQEQLTEQERYVRFRDEVPLEGEDFRINQQAGVEGDVESDGVFASFWRPHKLY